MNPGFRIEPTADKFTVFGPYNEDLAVHSTQEDAEQEINRCLEETESDGKDIRGVYCRSWPYLNSLFDVRMADVCTL